jgi:hypothetical protein
MAKKPYYTSNTLIEAVKRKMAMPISQVTFLNEDILAFADEEMFLAQVPSILQYHEEYLVYEQLVPMVPKQSKYAIPSRAIGMRIRDLFYRDLAGQLVQMSRINPDDRSFFEVNSNTTPIPIHYYVQNNQIVITPAVTQNSTGNLVFTYYMRPNSLVTDDQAAICEKFSKDITVSNLTLVAGNVLIINGYTLTAGTDFAIGTSDAATASNLSNAISLLDPLQFTTSITSNIITVFYKNRALYITSNNANALTLQSTITIHIPSTDTIPSSILPGTMVDILQAEGGHSTLNFDVLLQADAISLSSLTFKETDIPYDFVVGDYICSQYQCIIPQVPTDLHNLLAERTCARILESLGDKEGLQAANLKINELEQRQSTILDSRVEGSPLKILNRTGLLRSSRIRFGRRG